MSATPNDKTVAVSGLRDLTLEESGDLVRLEETIRRGLATFFEVGEALTEIHDRKLYLIEHTTFADYCKVKWKMSDRRARQLMGAAEVVADISKSGTIVPKTESQARPLTALPSEQRPAAWTKAVASSPDGQPTAKAVEVVVAKMKPKAPHAVQVVVDNPQAQTPKAANGGVREREDDGDDLAGDPPATPLHQITRLIRRLWPQLSVEDRNLLCNCIAGLRGGS